MGTTTLYEIGVPGRPSSPRFLPWSSFASFTLRRIEYRELKDYWSLNGVKVPFELRLINGMNRPIPELTVLIGKVTIDRREKVYELHIKKVIGFKHWEKDRQKPKR